MTIKAIHERFPNYDVLINLTFDLVGKLEKIKDPRFTQDVYINNGWTLQTTQYQA